MHRIRLRRPWTRTVGDQPPTEKIDVPDADPATVQAGTSVCYRRAFNRPTGLTPDTTLWLSIGIPTGDSLRVSLNGHTIQALTAIQTAQPIQLDLTAKLLGSNELVIELESEQAALCGLTADVALLIED
ncbi:hypothetical protein NHH03_19550 [Stieleria sp. TO1_6]|uniref:hypothetical protein n=1 Tax=Stieleria tagensis TaxID=2956795 RepID=UPI00209B8406|nr:hypothetical protein [Stieleria tagensis]MCO8123949.1 hypothetical protein [Stieleria tagensis]